MSGRRLALIADMATTGFVGLLDMGGRLLAHARNPRDRKGEHAHVLLGDCLGRLGADTGDISAAAVCAGPGSFTGIRVGVALVQGLCFAERLPIHPYSSLEAMLCLVPEGARGLAVIAAQAGRVYVRSTLGPEEWVEDLPAAEERAALHDYLVRVALPDRPGALGTRCLALEDSYPFEAVWNLARAYPPARDGVIRPNYRQVSAAEGKRAAAGET